MTILLAVGDSITYGHWDRQGGWAQRLRAFLERRSLLSDDHHELNAKHYMAVYNLGIPGDTTEGVLKRLDQDVAPRLDPTQKTIIIFNVGINDSQFILETESFGVDLERFSDNLTSLVHRARRATDHVIFVGLTPVDAARMSQFWPAGDIVYSNDHVRTYDAEIRNVCRVHGVEFIDIFDSLYRSDYESLLEDGIHPNDRGHELLEGVIREHLLKTAVI